MQATARRLPVATAGALLDAAAQTLARPEEAMGKAGPVLDPEEDFTREALGHWLRVRANDSARPGPEGPRWLEEEESRGT